MDDEAAPRGRTPVTIEVASGASASAVLRAVGRAPVTPRDRREGHGARHVVLPAIAAQPPPATAPRRHHARSGGAFKTDAFKTIDD